jgi:hypothetical protein
MKKVIAYLISVAGLVSLGLGTFSKNAGLEAFSGISQNLLTIGGIVLILVGVAFLKFSGSGSSKTPKEEQVAHEVPIYRGENIVGYRRKKIKK